MDIVDRLRSHWNGERIAEVSIDVADAADEIELLRTKQKIAVGMIKELLDFIEFIYDHPEFDTSLKAYEWIMFQIEMIMAKYNEPVGEER